MTVVLGGSARFVYRELGSTQNLKFELNSGDAVVLSGVGSLAHRAVLPKSGSNVVVLNARQVKRERMEISRPGPRLPSVQNILVDRKKADSNKSKVKSNGAVQTPVTVGVGNAGHYRGRKMGIDATTMFYVGRSGWPTQETRHRAVLGFAQSGLIEG